MSIKRLWQVALLEQHRLRSLSLCALLSRPFNCRYIHARFSFRSLCPMDINSRLSIFSLPWLDWISVTVSVAFLSLIPIRLGELRGKPFVVRPSSLAGIKQVIKTQSSRDASRFALMQPIYWIKVHRVSTYQCFLVFCDPLRLCFAGESCDRGARYPIAT